MCADTAVSPRLVTPNPAKPAPNKGTLGYQPIAAPGANFRLEEAVPIVRR